MLIFLTMVIILPCILKSNHLIVHFKYTSQKIIEKLDEWINSDTALMIFPRFTLFIPLFRGYTHFPCVQHFYTCIKTYALLSQQPPSTEEHFNGRRLPQRLESQMQSMQVGWSCCIHKGWGQCVPNNFKVLHPSSCKTQPRESQASSLGMR